MTKVRERSDGRAADELRPVTIEPGFVRTATGSALITCGGTRVICTASVQESVPRWMTGKGRGWMTAEYGMLPASTGERKQRDISKGKQDGRGIEIQRLIGRSLRGVADLEALGERTIYVDCDVLEADGGTRCAAITGGYVALALAVRRLQQDGLLAKSPLTGSIAAVSCGVVDGVPLLDLDYPEDSSAEVDANVVMTGEGGLVEIQATAERTPLSRTHLDELLRSRRPGSRACARRRKPRCDEAAARDAQRPQAARVRPAAARRDARPAARGAPEPGGDRRHLRRERADQGPRGGAGDRRDGLRRRFGDRGRGAGLAPGVRTARFAGEHATDGENLAKLHREAPAGSRARYVCVIAHVTPEGEETLFEGTCEGTLAERPSGAGGFGYDPLFVADEAPGRTMAELTDEEKDAISHRGRAARALLAWLSTR